MPAPSRGPIERLVAWTLTGPPGHAWSALADIAVFWARWLAQRMLAGAAKRSRRSR